jgi:hypothetical protein
MIKRKSDFLTFSDGWGTSYDVIDRRYKASEAKQAVIHFREKTVGERRYWDAYVNGIEITKVIAVPIASKVDYGDLFEIAGTQYVVAQKQTQDTQPQSWLLSLQTAPIEYKVKDTT